MQLRQGKSQLAAVLNGQSGNSPDWELIKDLVDSYHRYADEHGRPDRLCRWRPVPRKASGSGAALAGGNHELMMLDALAEKTTGAGTAVLTAVGGTRP